MNGGVPKLFLEDTLQGVILHETAETTAIATLFPVPLLWSANCRKVNTKGLKVEHQGHSLCFVVCWVKKREKDPFLLVC